MSGIYITVMGMPSFGHQGWDIRKGADGKWYMVDTNAETSDGAWHEIVPVPEHGPLVDALEVINTFPEEYIFTNEQARALTNYIIPASKEGE